MIIRKSKTYNLKPITSHRGFTLVELLISMGLLAIILSVLTSLFVSVIESQLESKSISSVDQDGRFILARLSYDIHRADNVITPSTLGGQGSTLQIAIGGITYTYGLNVNALEITNNQGTDRINSPNTTISNMSFTRLGNTLSGKNTIAIEFTITSTITHPRPEIRSYRTTVGIR